MGVPVTKSPQQDPAAVRPAVPVGIFQEQELGILPDIDTPFPPLQPGRDVQALGKHGRPVRPAVIVPVLQKDHLVVGQAPGEDMGVGCRDRHVHSPGGIPAKVQWRCQALLFRGEQIDLESLRDAKGGEFFFHVGIRVGMEFFWPWAVGTGVLLSPGDLPDTAFRQGDLRMEELPFFPKGDPVFSAAGKLPRGVVPEQEFPVCWTPEVVPEPVFFHHCQP